MSEQRDERVRELCETLRESGRVPIVRNLPFGRVAITHEPDEHRPIRATVNADGTARMVWADGSVTHSPVG